MKKSDLIAALSARTNTTKAHCAQMLLALREIAEVEITNGRSFEIGGVVNLTVQTRAARKGRNPATGSVIDIAEKRVIKSRVPASLTSMAG